MKQQVTFMDLQTWRLLVAQPVVSGGIARGLVATLSWLGVPVVFWILIVGIGLRMARQIEATSASSGGPGAATTIAQAQITAEDTSPPIQALPQGFSGSELEFLSWQTAGSVLSSKVANNTNPDAAGVLRFTGVSFANLPPKVEITGIGLGAPEDLQNAQAESYAGAAGSWPGSDPGATLFAIRAANGEKFVVIADRVDFDRDP